MSLDPEIDDIDDDAEEPAGSKRLTAAEWAEACELWNLGAVSTLAELSERFGISAPAMSRGLKKRDASKGRKAREMADAVAAAAKKAAETTAAASASSAVAVKMGFADQRNIRIEETKTQHYDWSVMLGKLAMGELARAQRDGVPFANVAANLKALRHAEAVIRGVRQERFDLLDAHGEVDEKSLPDLIIRDLTENELATLRLRNDEDDGLIVTPPLDLDDLVVEE